MKEIFKTTTGRSALLLLIVVLNIGCDQQTKIMASEQLIYGETLRYMNDFFRLILVENEGAFLSWGADMSGTMRIVLLKIIPSLVLIGLAIYVFFSRQVSLLQGIAFSFVLGGGTSNIFDRFFNNGAVVDFMNLGIGSLRTGIFNFADVSIMFGIGLLIFAHFKERNSHPPEIAVS